MKGSHSRLLQVVIAAMLINAAPDGRADTYDLQPMTVYPDDFWDDSAYFEADYNNWEFNDYSEPSESDGVDTEANLDQAAECAAIAGKVTSSCDLNDPPLLVVNGCGSDGSSFVPDYLLVYGIPAVGFGPIFQGACNAHDVCYGTFPGDKEACDLSLNTNMINLARTVMTFREWIFYGPFVKMQALAYSAGLQAPFISSASGAAFDSAQLEGACRYYEKVAKNKGCLD